MNIDPFKTAAMSRSFMLASVLALAFLFLPGLASAHAYTTQLPLATPAMDAEAANIVSPMLPDFHACQPVTWRYQEVAQEEIREVLQMRAAMWRLMREKRDMASILRRLAALSYVDPDLLERLNRVYKELREVHGYTVMPVETFRSPERQASLLATGGGVTTVGAMRSCHQYGLAVDSVVFRNGVPQWDVDDPWTMRGYQLFGELAEREGLDWGGRWTNPRDYAHVEKRSECHAARNAAPQYFAALSMKLALARQ